MTIQQTLESLIKHLPHDEASELRTVLQAWPTDDPELQQLLDTHTGEILKLFQQPLPETSTTPKKQDTLVPSFSNLSQVVPLTHLN